VQIRANANKIRIRIIRKSLLCNIILQNRRPTYIQFCNMASKHTDFLLVQELWMMDSKNTISNSAYYIILPDTLEKPRVVIYTRKEFIFEFCQLNYCKDPDIIIFEISGPGIKKFRIFNVYNERRKIENSNN
jgi:hypothetical protein